jgi:hypothetical protein
MSSITKIRPVEAELFHVGWQTDMMKLIVALLSFWTRLNRLPRSEVVRTLIKIHIFINTAFRLLNSSLRFAESSILQLYVLWISLFLYCTGPTVGGSQLLRYRYLITSLHGFISHRNLIFTNDSYPLNKRPTQTNTKFCSLTRQHSPSVLSVRDYSRTF